MDNQTLRPSQDFQVGDKVTYNGEEGVVFKIEEESRFPVRVKLPNDVIEAFTADGRTWWAGQIVLFHLEESDKQPESEQTDKQDSAFLQTLNELLSTKTKTMDRAQDELDYIVDRDLSIQVEKWYIEAKAEVTLLKHLIEVYKGLEEDTTHVSVGI